VCAAGYVAQAPTDQEDTMTTMTATRPLVRTGFAIVTITSRQTGAHLTYRVRACKPWTDRNGVERPGVGYWIDLRTADQDWLSCGKLNDGGHLQTTRNATDDRTALFVAQRVGWALLSAPLVDTDDDVPAVEWDVILNDRRYGCHLEDRCSNCGASLTDPQSIATGLGPDCEAKITGVRRKKTSRRAKAGS
jgi:hypothetical protein